MEKVLITERARIWMSWGGAAAARGGGATAGIMGGGGATAGIMGGGGATDKWKGYSALPRHGFVHLVVNHSRGFVDPLTGVHTNTCEGMWFHAKKHMLRGHGRTRADSEALKIALCEFMWRKRRNLTRSDASVRRAFNSEIPKLMRRVLS